MRNILTFIFFFLFVGVASAQSVQPQQIPVPHHWVPPQDWTPHKILGAPNPKEGETEPLSTNVDISSFNCPDIPLPDWQSLTNRQAANLLTDMYNANVKCKASLEAIKGLLNNSRIVVIQGK